MLRSLFGGRDDDDATPTAHDAIAEEWYAARAAGATAEALAEIDARWRAELAPARAEYETAAAAEAARPWWKLF